MYHKQICNLTGAVILRIKKYWKCINPISIKVGTLSKNAIKTKIYNFFIQLNLYLTDKRTKKICSVFSMMNYIVFVKYKLIQKLMTATHSKKSLEKDMLDFSPVIIRPSMCHSSCNHSSGIFVSLLPMMSPCSPIHCCLVLPWSLWTVFPPAFSAQPHFVDIFRTSVQAVRFVVFLWVTIWVKATQLSGQNWQLEITQFLIS